MAPPQVDQQHQLTAAISAFAATETTGLWPHVDWESPHAATAVKQLWGAIITRYGQASAAVAAQFYDELRGEKPLPSRFSAAPADPIPQAVLDRIVDSAFLGDADTSHVHVTQDTTTSELPVEQRVAARLENATQRLVLQPARDTIARNVEADPARPRYIRVPRGAKTCAFCVMLASRELGPSFRGYQSHQTALFKANGGKYHNHCDCDAVPVFPGDDPHELSPNMPDYQDMYYKATADAGTHSDTSKILASMRRLHGLK